MGGDEDLMLVREAASQANVPVSRVHYWIKRGWLSAQPARNGRLVSLAAVQALALTAAAPQARPVHGPRELPGDVAAYVPPSVAARQMGLAPGVVSQWATTGKVASKPGPYGRLVRLADVQDYAQRAGRRKRRAETADEGTPL